MKHLKYVQSSTTSHQIPSFKSNPYQTSTIQKCLVNKKINSLTHKRLNSFLRSRKQAQQLEKHKIEVLGVPKQKITQMIYGIKPHEVFQEIIQQKQELLKKQEQQLQIQKQNTKINENKLNLTPLKLQNVAEVNDQQLISEDEKDNTQILHKQSYLRDLKYSERIKRPKHERERSKTQNSRNCYEQLNENTETLKPTNQYESNLSHYTKTLKQGNNLNQTCPIKLQKCGQILNKSNRKKIELKMSSKMIHPSTQTVQRKNQSLSNTVKRSISQKDEKFPIKSKNNIKLSKSVMAQKIINIKKTLYNTNRRRSFSLRQGNQNQQNQFHSIPMLNAKTIQCFNFPVMNNQEQKKMTFQQLFHYQKKKMQLLKKLLNEEVNFKQPPSHQRSTQQQCEFQFVLKNQIILEHILSSNNDVLNSLSNQKCENNLIRSPPKSIIQQKEAINIKTMNKKIKQQQQLFLSINSLQKNSSSIRHNNLSSNRSIQLQSEDETEDDTSKSKRKKKQSLITTFNFDYIQKRKPQRPQINQLRQKYLYSSKRRFSKEDYNQQDISIVSVHGEGQQRVKKWQRRLATESFVEDFLQIQRKDLTQFNRSTRIPQNFTKTMKNQHKKYKTLGDIQEKDMQGKDKIMAFGKIDAWQSKKQNFYNLDDDISQFNN